MRRKARRRFLNMNTKVKETEDRSGSINLEGILTCYIFEKF